MLPSMIYKKIKLILDINCLIIIFSYNYVKVDDVKSALHELENVLSFPLKGKLIILSKICL